MVRADRDLENGEENDLVDTSLEDAMDGRSPEPLYAAKGRRRYDMRQKINRKFFRKTILRTVLDVIVVVISRRPRVCTALQAYDSGAMILTTWILRHGCEGHEQMRARPRGPAILPRLNWAGNGASECCSRVPWNAEKFLVPTAAAI
jgi:hypothetical protein